MDVLESRCHIGKPNPKTNRIKHGAEVKVWRFLRAVSQYRGLPANYQHRNNVPNILKILLSKSSYRVAVLISHVIGVSLRLKDGVIESQKASSTLGDNLLHHQDNIIAFYSTSILSSKTLIPRYASVSLNKGAKTLTGTDLVCRISATFHLQ